MILLVLMILFGLPLVLSLLVDTGGLPGKEETVQSIGFHLTLGFALFLFREFSAIVADVRVWMAFAVLVAIAAALTWILGRLWMRSHGSHWSARQRLLLTLLLTTWFAVSLFVCEGARRAAEFRHMRWTTATYATHHGSVQGMMTQLRFKLWLIAKEKDRFPESLAGLQPRGSGLEGLLFHPDAELPPELPIYLAGGLPTRLDPSFTLLISPCYRGQAGIWKRTVNTADGKDREIDDSETAEWIQRALDLRRSLASP